MKAIASIALSSLLTFPAIALAQPAIDDDAASFGEQEAVFSAALSADGTRMVFIGPANGSSTVAEVVDLAASTVKEVARADGVPLNLHSCDWSAADRLVCSLYGVTRQNTVLLARDSHGGHGCGRQQAAAPGTAQYALTQLELRQFDGDNRRLDEWRRRHGADVAHQCRRDHHRIA